VPELTPADRSLRAKIAANTKWSTVLDRSEATQPARDAFLQRFENQVDPNNELPEGVRKRNAESARRAYFQRLAYESARVRRAKKSGDSR